MNKVSTAKAAGDFSNFINRIIDDKRPACILAMYLENEQDNDDGSKEYSAKGSMLTLGVEKDAATGLLRALAVYATNLADDIEGVQQ